MSLKVTASQAQIKGRKPQPKLPRRTWGLRSCSSGVKQRLREQLPCSCLHPLPAEIRFCSIQATNTGSAIELRAMKSWPPCAACNCAFAPLPAEIRFCSIQATNTGSAIELRATKSMATVRRLQLRFCSRPSQRVPQPQKWVRFSGPNNRAANSSLRSKL